ncbi:MAG: hypothetical protein MK142_01175, partial [Pseudomonadales bacterium]|nr:hypothetical protein [Pseudomonadales bacterium]
RTARTRRRAAGTRLRRPPGTHEARLGSPSPYVDNNGNVSLPEDVHATTTHLGSWFVPAGDVSSSYDANADAVRVHRARGEFPDGAVLVTELRAHSSGSYAAGRRVS